MRTATSSADARVLPPHLRKLYPFNSHFFEVDGGRLHYVDEGSKDAPVMLALHGNPTWSFFFRDVISAFFSTHRVVAPDQLGCGLSDKPRHGPYRLDDRIRHVERLVDALSLKDITLVVHDWGGAIGMGVAVEQPARFRRLVVLNSAAFGMKRIPRSIAFARTPGIGRFLIQRMNLFSRLALVWAMHDPKRMGRAVRDGLLFPYDSYDHRVAIWRFVEDIPMSPSHPSWDRLMAIDEGLHKLKNHPMLLAWGARDFCFDDVFLAEWIRRFPHAEVERFEDAGHYVLEEAGSRVIARMKTFLGPDIKAKSA